MWKLSGKNTFFGTRQIWLWIPTGPITSYATSPCANLFQSCLTLCNLMDCSPPGSSVHGIYQARILEWAAMPFSRGSSQPRDWNCITYISCIGRHVLYHWCHLGSPPTKIFMTNYLTLEKILDISDIYKSQCYQEKDKYSCFYYLFTHFIHSQ